MMHPILRASNRLAVSTALAALLFQAGEVFSASTVTLYNPNNLPPNPPWPASEYTPGGFVYLVSTDASFNNGQYYAGVIYGTFDLDDSDSIPAVDGAFFCAELNKAATYGSSVAYASNDLSLLPSPLTNGSTTSTPIALSAKQVCLLNSVYAQLGVDSRYSYTSNVAQDLTGTTAEALEMVRPGLSDEEAVAAQLVMWEIIHEPNSALLSPTVPIISLTEGNLKWYANSNGDSLDSDIISAFNDFATTAYSHCGPFTPVPEITSPVALIAGGLLFIRRREPRKNRLKQSRDR